MNKLLTLFLFFSCFISAQGQKTDSKVGYYFDIDGENIEDYYDLDYEPKKSFELLYNIGVEFSPGYYYSSNGIKTQGLIKYLQNNSDFKFKTSLEEKAITIKANQCTGFVIGLDSFATINYTDIVGRNKMPFTNLQLFAEVIEEAGSLCFYKQFNTNSSEANLLYYVKADSSKKIWIFPYKKEEFKEMAIQIFGSSEIIKKRIKSGEYTKDSMFNMIKLYKYKVLFETQEKIYLNSSFNEIRDPGRSVYYGNVEVTKDSIYRIVYYDIFDSKIFQGEFSSFNPTVKEGEFIYYYPNGVIRKSLSFKGNSPIKGITYFKTGKKHREFSHTSDGKKYEYVFDKNEKKLLNETGNGEEIIYDSLNSRELIYEYVNYKLINVYFLDDTQIRIYQYCQNNIKTNSFSEVKKMFSEKAIYPAESIKNSVYGTVLLKCQIDPKGKISKVKIIKGVNPEINMVVQSFVPNIRAYNTLESGKIEREKVHQEVVVPFEFALVGFSRTSMYNSKFWLNRGLNLTSALMNALLR